MSGPELLVAIETIHMSIIEETNKLTVEYLYKRK
jgi:hypothetical protein